MQVHLFFSFVHGRVHPQSKGKGKGKGKGKKGRALKAAQISEFILVCARKRVEVGIRRTCRILGSDLKLAISGQEGISWSASIGLRSFQT